MRLKTPTHFDRDPPNGMLALPVHTLEDMSPAPAILVVGPRGPLKTALATEIRRFLDSDGTGLVLGPGDVDVSRGSGTVAADFAVLVARRIDLPHAQPTRVDHLHRYFDPGNPSLAEHMDTHFARLQEGALQPTTVVLDRCGLAALARRPYADLLLTASRDRAALLVIEERLLPQLSTRSPFDYVFVTGGAGPGALEQLHRAHFDWFPNLATFQSAYDLATVAPPGALVMDNRCGTGRYYPMGRGAVSGTEDVNGDRAPACSCVTRAMSRGVSTLQYMCRAIRPLGG